MKLTRTNIARLTLPAGATDKIYFDDGLEGFGLRIRAGGSRKWVYHYRQGGIQRRYTIGSAAALDVDEARRRARKVRVQVDDGKDPAAEKLAKRNAAGLTVSSVADDYLEARQRDLKPRSHEECSRHLKNHWKPLRGLAISGVSRAVVAARLREIASENGPVAADRARATLSALFSWAIGEGLCEVNPVIGTNRASGNAPRDRLLTDLELAAIWKAAPDNDYGRIVKILMLTAQRRDEIGGLRWSELENISDPTKAMIAFPPARVKNTKALRRMKITAHEVPLSQPALNVLAKPRTAGRDLIFGRGEGSFSGWSKAKDALDTVCKVPDWNVHDLRRTAATRMADLGVQPHIVEAILNHISGHKAGVAGIYNRSTYAKEKRAALDLWANHVEVIVAQSRGANVHQLKPRASR